MDRMSVFLAADNESGHVQAVIAEKDFQFSKGWALLPQLMN